MEKNIKTARTHRALALLYGLGSTILIFFAYIIPEVLKPMIFGVVVFLGLSFLHYSIAKGAKNRQNWARLASQAIAVLMLFGFPIGTLIGVSLLSNTWSPWEAEST